MPSEKSKPDNRHREPMTDSDKRLATLLSPSRVTYLPASADKRFARQMADTAKREQARITPRQREYLYQLARRYRRQAPEAYALVEEASGGGSAQVDTLPG